MTPDESRLADDRIHHERGGSRKPPRRVRGTLNPYAEEFGWEGGPVAERSARVVLGKVAPPFLLRRGRTIPARASLLNTLNPKP